MVPCFSFRQAVAQRLRGRSHAHSRSRDGVRLGVPHQGSVGDVGGDERRPDKRRWRAMPGPVRIEGANITGDGWTVTVAPGWTVRPGLGPAITR